MSGPCGTRVESLCGRGGGALHSGNVFLAHHRSLGAQASGSSGANAQQSAVRRAEGRADIPVPTQAALIGACGGAICATAEVAWRGMARLGVGWFEDMTHPKMHIPAR